MEVLFVRIIWALGASLAIVGLSSLIDSFRTTRRDKLTPDRHKNSVPHRSLEAMFAENNPGISWLRAEIIEENRTISFPFPIWNSWVLVCFPELLDRIVNEFFEKFRQEINNSRICAVSAGSFFLFAKYEAHFKDYGIINLFPLNPTFGRPSALPKNWYNSNLCLVDSSFNTGATMSEAFGSFHKAGWEPKGQHVSFLNDLVPPAILAKENRWKAEESDYVFRSSDVIKHWEDTELVDDILVMNAAARGEVLWDESLISRARQRLKTFSIGLRTPELGT